VIAVGPVLPVIEGHSILDPHEPSALGPVSAAYDLFPLEYSGNFFKRYVTFETSVDFALDLLPVSVLESLPDG